MLKQTLHNKLLHNQKGAFSPFMYGMLMGLAVLSAVTAYQAQQALKKIEQDKIQGQKKSVKDIRNALENAILSENSADASNNYSATLDLNRAKAFTSRSTGKTRAGSDYTIRERDGATTFGQVQKRLLITSSDDTLLKADVTSQLNADSLSDYQAQADASQAVEIFDSEEFRRKQVERSKEYLQMEASQLYRYYAQNNFTFPTSNAVYLATVNNITGLKDVWGNDFIYTFTNATTATIAFTTPWTYTVTINLSMN